MKMTLRHGITPPRSAALRALAAPFCLLGVFVLAVACESTEEPEDDGRATKGALLIQDANNYNATSVLDTSATSIIETASGENIQICWNQFSADMQCHATATTDIKNVAVVRFDGQTEPEVAATLVTGGLDIGDVGAYFNIRPTLAPGAEACVNLQDMSYVGASSINVATDYVAPAAGAVSTYVLLLADQTDPGLGTKSIRFLRPTVGSTTTRVEVPSACGSLEFQVDLTSDTASPEPLPLSIPAAGPWVVDWSKVTADGAGVPIQFPKIDRVMVGFYAGLDLAYIEQNSFDFEAIATARWELALTEITRSADLARAVGVDGTVGVFPGFQMAEPGIWMLGIFCSTCQNPAPAIVTVLQPTTQAAATP